MSRFYQEKTLSVDEDGWYEHGPLDDLCDVMVEHYPRYICTRRTGHTGPHAAHGGDDQYATWYDDNLVVTGWTWCAKEKWLLADGPNHLRTCSGPHHYVTVSDEKVESPPHKHTPQVMHNAAGVAVSVCCAGCGLNEDLTSPCWATDNSVGTAI